MIKHLHLADKRISSDLCKQVKSEAISIKQENIEQ